MKFKVGEVAIFAWTDNPQHKKFLGHETSITNTGMSDPLNINEPTYELDIIDGHSRVICYERCLRKKKGREIDQIVSWDECYWKPGVEICG